MKPVHFLIFCSFLFVIGCSPSTREAPPVAEKPPLAETPKPKPVPKDSALDQVARFVAGLPQLESNAYAELEKEEGWKNFRLEMDSGWARMERMRMRSMRVWRDAELATKINDSLRLFYPFSGPDFLHAQIFYPKAPEVIMAALEPVIAMPDFKGLQDRSRGMFLDTLGNSLRDLFGKSYFITLHMMKDFRKIKGVLPVFYFLIARTGNEMVSQKYFVLDDQGASRFVPIDSLKGHTGGVQLTFRSGLDAPLRTLWYFSGNIDNKGLKAHPEFMAFVQGRRPYNAFVKSASYLMHMDGFSGVREELIQGASSLFQDDTGIPYRFLKKQPFTGFFFGEYIRPVKDFSWLDKQADLDSAYIKSKQPLPFSLGYHWSTRQQNYMLFVRNPVKN